MGRDGGVREKARRQEWPILAMQATCRRRGRREGVLSHQLAIWMEAAASRTPAAATRAPPRRWPSAAGYRVMVVARGGVRRRDRQLLLIASDTAPEG